MSLSFTKQDKELLEISDDEHDRIMLVVNTQFEDIVSSRKTNNTLVTAFQIIMAKLAICSSKIKEMEHNMDIDQNNAATRLIEAKIMWPEQMDKLEANRKAREEWNKTRKLGNDLQISEFVPPNDTTKFLSVVDLTPADPSKLTDKSIEALSKKYAYGRLGKDYVQLMKAYEMLKNIKDTLIKIGDRVESTIMTFAIEHKLSGGGR